MPRRLRGLLCACTLFGAFFLCAQSVLAGVIIWQEEPSGPNGHEYLLEIIQGHKEWLASGTEPQEISHVMGAVVDDLDKRARITIDYRRKLYYVENPFPEEVGDQVNPRNVDDFKPTGKVRKIAGYSCEEYIGTGDSARWGRVTEVFCVSKDAPGLREYAEFMNLLNRIYVAAGFVDGSYGNEYPGLGYPLGISGIILASGRERGWVVTKIESRKVPERQFEVPAGFVRKQPP